MVKTRRAKRSGDAVYRWRTRCALTIERDLIRASHPFPLLQYSVIKAFITRAKPVTESPFRYSAERLAASALQTHTALIQFAHQQTFVPKQALTSYLSNRIHFLAHMSENQTSACKF